MRISYLALVVCFVFVGAEAQAQSKKPPKPVASKSEDAAAKSIRRMEEQNRRWDAQMRKVTSSICRGC